MLTHAGRPRHTGMHYLTSACTPHVHACTTQPPSSPLSRDGPRVDRGRPTVGGAAAFIRAAAASAAPAASTIDASSLRAAAKRAAADAAADSASRSCGPPAREAAFCHSNDHSRDAAIAEADDADATAGIVVSGAWGASPDDGDGWLRE
eukprot:366223-Chlamydomonas_euryale.AAC.10